MYRLDRSLEDDLIHPLLDEDTSHITMSRAHASPYERDGRTDGNHLSVARPLQAPGNLAFNLTVRLELSTTAA